MKITSMDHRPSDAEFRAIRTDALTDAILSTFECQGLTRATAVYVSTPITSGEAILRWHQSISEGTEQRTASSHLELVRENIARAAPLIDEVRRRFAPQPVVDPTSLRDVPGFSQPDYHRLWSAFIERYARIVIFNDSWELSTGCAVEFATAAITGKILLDADFAELPNSVGLQRLKEASLRLETAGRPVDLHNAVINALLDHIGE